MTTEDEAIRGTREHVWRYFLEIGKTSVEVTKEEYVAAEWAAGYRSKFGHYGPATASFSHGSFGGYKEFWSEQLERWVLG